MHELEMAHEKNHGSGELRLPDVSWKVNCVPPSCFVGFEVSLLYRVDRKQDSHELT